MVAARSARIATAAQVFTLSEWVREPFRRQPLTGMALLLFFIVAYTGGTILTARESKVPFPHTSSKLPHRRTNKPVVRRWLVG